MYREQKSTRPTVFLVDDSDLDQPEAPMERRAGDLRWRVASILAWLVQGLCEAALQWLLAGSSQLAVVNP